MGIIADTIYKELNYMYCDNCRYNSEITDKDEYGCNPHCEDCHRKYNGWAVSKQTAEDIEDIINTSTVEQPQGDLADEVWKLYKKHQSHLATYVLEFGYELKDLLGKYQKGGEEE